WVARAGGGPARPDAGTAVDAITERIRSGDGATPDSRLVTPDSRLPTPDSAVAVGDRVIVGGLGLEALVTSIHDGTADLDVRGKRMRASVRDLRVVAGARPQAAAAPGGGDLGLPARDTTPPGFDAVRLSGAQGTS